MRPPVIGVGRQSVESDISEEHSRQWLLPDTARSSLGNGSNQNQHESAGGDSVPPISRERITEIGE